MLFTLDLDTVTHSIQLAIAPVFLLTAVAATIGTCANRLARIVDRARILEERVEGPHAEESMTAAYTELRRLRLRGRLVNSCIALLTMSALLIGLTIMALFLGKTGDIQAPGLATLLFLSGVSSYLLALLCFFGETMLATRILRFAKPKER